MSHPSPILAPRQGEPKVLLRFGPAQNGSRFWSHRKTVGHAASRIIFNEVFPLGVFESYPKHPKQFQQGAIAQLRPTPFFPSQFRWWRPSLKNCLRLQPFQERAAATLALFPLDGCQKVAKVVIVDRREWQTCPPSTVVDDVATDILLSALQLGATPSRTLSAGHPML